MGAALDETRFFIYAIPVPGVSLSALEAATEAVVTEIARDGFSEADVARAKTRLVAEAIYARDSQMTLANWYGSSLATGLTLEDIEEWPARIEAVTSQDVRAAVRHIARKYAVSGYLLQEEPAAV
jgi:Predicted Zn-dependent peptidases